MPSPDSYSDEPDSTATEPTDSVSAQARETGADEDSELIQPEDEGYSRDPQTGELQPEIVFVEQLGGKIKIIPPTSDEEERWLDPIRGGDGEGVLTDAMLAEIMNLKVVAPDVTKREDCPDHEVTEQWVRNHMAKPRQKGYVAGLARAAHDEDLYERLHGRIPENEQDLVAKIAAEGGDLSGLADDAQGNGPRR